MKLSNKLKSILIGVASVGLVVLLISSVSCSNKNNTDSGSSTIDGKNTNNNITTTIDTNSNNSSNSNTSSSTINVEEQKSREEAIKEETKPEENKSVVELENKAKMLLSYEGLLKEFTYTGSRGNVELIVGEPNSENVEKMLFTINLDNILYDADNECVIPPSKLIDGDKVKLYAMDNSKTSAITPVAIVKGDYKDLELISADKVENLTVNDSSINIISDKLSSTLIYVDDATVIVNAFSGEPILVSDLKDTDKLFVKTTKHDIKSKTQNNKKDSENKDKKSEKEDSKDVNLKENTEIVNDVYSKTKKATHISVYRESVEQE